MATVVQSQDVKKQRHEGRFLALLNRPYILLTIPLLVAGFWLVQHIDIITNNLDKPYALLAGPALVGSGLAGWLIIAFFRTIAAWCKASFQAFQSWLKTDGSTFWLVIAIFLVVSVMESGSYFDGLLGSNDIFGSLGYAIAFVVDLVAVQCMRARLSAVRMRDKKGARLYLLGVIACASLSAFANSYTGLIHYVPPSHAPLLPWLWITVAPWTAMAFPLLIIFLSFTADYTADQTSTKLDPETYKTQEEKRIKLLEIQRDMLKLRLAIEQEIDTMSAHLKEHEREFFLVGWLMRRKVQSVDYSQIVEEMKVLFTSETTQLATLVQSLQTQLDDMKKQPGVTPVVTNQMSPEVEEEVIPEITPKVRITTPSSVTDPDTGEHEAIAKSVNKGVPANVTNFPRGDASKRVLRVLKRCPEITPAELAKRAKVSRPYASRIRSQILSQQSM